MTKLSRCACCDGALEPAQQLRYLVETDNLDNPTYLNQIRVLPSVNGKPLPVCKACQSELARNPTALKVRKQVPLAFFGALSALSLGLLLGSLFNPRA